MTLCYIGIGSNLNQPLQQVRLALQALARIPGIRLLRRSPWYVSKAVGPGEQPDYLNGVIELDTTLDAPALLHALQQIETRQGRERHIRWGARSLDLDILLYGDHYLDTPELQIPHPRIRERAFVLAPLADLNPGLQLAEPAGGKSATIAALLAGLPAPAGELQLLDGEREVVRL
jgi:2-amino-4-hydroxy-6-hydroxymethyldihydropteridine diphosphokinase